MCELLEHMSTMKILQSNLSDWKEWHFKWIDHFGSIYNRNALKRNSSSRMKSNLQFEWFVTNNNGQRTLGETIAENSQETDIFDIQFDLTIIKIYFICMWRKVFSRLAYATYNTAKSINNEEEEEIYTYKVPKWKLLSFFSFWFLLSPHKRANCLERMRKKMKYWE